MEQYHSHKSVATKGLIFSDLFHLFLFHTFPCPWDPGTLEPLDLWTIGPWDSWTSSLLLLLIASCYLLLSLLPTLLLLYIWVMGGVSCDIGEWDWRWTCDIYIDLKKSSSNHLPPPSYSSQLLHPPPNSSYLLPMGLRWLISSYMKRFQCYSAQKSFTVGDGWIHCNYSYKLQVQVS